MLKYILIIFLFSFLELSAQCGCPGNGGSVDVIPLSELANADSTGISYSDNLFINLLNRNAYADTYINHDIPIGQGFIKNYQSNFLSFRLGYKTSPRLIFEAEVGYFLDKTMDRQIFDKSSSRGFSDLSLYSRYTFYKDIENGIDLSTGAGLKIPLTRGNEYIPQNIQPSTGGYAIVYNFVAKKSIQSINSALVLAHKTDINFKNKYDYKYGNMFITSLFFLNNLFDSFVIGTEIRSQVQLRDYDYKKNEQLNESGMYGIIVSPLVRYTVQDITFNAFFDFPAYQYYNGNNGQLGNKNSFGLGISYSTHVFF